MKSIFKDEWLVLDNNNNEIGKIKEDNGGLAFLRRFITSLIPQTYYCFVGEYRAIKIKQKFNPFLYKIDIDFSSDTSNLLDRRLGISAAILLGAIEGRQG